MFAKNQFMERLRRSTALACGIATALACPPPDARTQPHSPLDALGIEVRGASRPFVYTNKESAFYYGETGSPNLPGWEGFTVYGHKFLDDYGILVNGSILDRSSATSTIVYPDYLVRTYPGGIREEFRVADSLPVFAVTVTSPSPGELGVYPLVDDGKDSSSFVIITKENTALVARKRHLARTSAENYPVWLCMKGLNVLPARKERRTGREYAPALLYSRRGRSHTVVFSVGDAAAEAEGAAQEYLGGARRLNALRRIRMERLLARGAVRTLDPGFDKAFAWAMLSLDALVMNQPTRGIFAGLPWFDNYWGRDTFISLPGAVLCTGDIADAKSILRTFAQHQQTDSTSTDYGRIPNLITTTGASYNTADGTPRFVMMAREYAGRSGDSLFVLEIYPTVLRSIEGTIRYHTDGFGFLRHGDAETWMDAVGPEGPWSPRGDRANDIQALWAGQLDAGVWFATRVGDAVSARAWHDLEERLKGNFPPHFAANGVVADHLLPDGTRDMHLRPNQIFAGPLVDEHLRARIVHTVVDRLTCPYGVMSLSPDDSNFHPYHLAPQFYPKDAAYHNGTVWTWLQGQLISELCHFKKQDVAMRLTANSVQQILDRGAVGTLSELIDAVPHPGEPAPRLSGTVSQAWSLAEFVRNVDEDYIGAKLDLLDGTLTLSPHLPRDLGRVAARIMADDVPIDIELNPYAQPQTVTLKTGNLPRPLEVTVELPSGRGSTLRAGFSLLPRSVMQLAATFSSSSLTRNGRTYRETTQYVVLPNYDQELEPLIFATPGPGNDWKTLHGPGFPLIDGREITATSTTAATLLDVPDPSGDDVGTGTYTYPSNPAFVPGCLDLTHFTVSYDSAAMYFTLGFRALSDPGWHPEYGFQLTFAAIAVDEDGIPGSGGRKAGHNSGYVVDDRYAFERLILVGGGVQIEDGKGAILAAYVPTPEDESHPLGDVARRTVHFAIPLKYLGAPNPRWTFTVLVGAQDDHGGAGLGEFRTVSRDGGEWTGGGKRNPDDPNVYDTLVASPAH